MSYVILTKEQAGTVEGRYGIYSEIKPLPLPDGKFFIPEDVLVDNDLVTAKIKIEAVASDIQDITDLPAIGSECIKGRLYKYSGGIDNASTGIVKCVQTHNRTIYAPETTPALFTFFRENSDTLEWIPNEKVELGWKRMHNGVQYEVIQAHMTLSTWTPDATPTLWRLVAPSTAAWAYPVAYKVNDIVTYQGNTYKCRQAHTSIATWNPVAAASLWLLV
jgi:hypothetical protein